MIDIEDVSMRPTDVDNENIDKFKEMILELYKSYDNTKSQNECKTSFTKQFHKLSNKYSKKYRINIKKSNLVYVYKIMISANEITYEDKFQKCLQKKPINGQSGVHPVTIMFPPKYTINNKTYEFTCEHNCYFCPDHPDFPRSYLPGEPASERGMKENFSAMGQMNNNIKRLIRNGHVPDKFDLIFEGGTLQEFDPDFLEEYFKECYYTANTYYDALPKRPPYNIKEEIEYNNEFSKIKIIGLCIETRPDTLLNKDNSPNEFWIVFFRKVGVTRIQLGVTHTNNRILKYSNRGHTYECSVRATKILKENGFKVAHHYMPSLPYATPQIDYDMFNTVYSSSDGRPHEIKIYPYSVVDNSVFKSQYDNNKFSLYSETDPDEYMRLMSFALNQCPEDIRIARTIRDIPSNIIYGGNKCPNLRQMIEKNITDAGYECKDIRSREISRRDNYILDDAIYDIKQLNNNDWFISCISEDRRALFGFLRLRLNSRAIYFTNDIVFKELFNTAIIQELHVYCKDGILVPVGQKIGNARQHKGVGKQLLTLAEIVSRRYLYTSIAVISGEGVRNYYEKNDYSYNNHSGRFMMKTFVDVYYIITLTILIIAIMLTSYYSIDKE